jgi:hypothetical protein
MRFLDNSDISEQFSDYQNIIVAGSGFHLPVWVQDADS